METSLSPAPSRCSLRSPVAFSPVLAPAIGVAVAASLAALPAEARAVAFSGGGTLGYESIRAEGSGDENLGGLGVSGEFQAEVSKLSGATGFLLGARLKYFDVEGEDDGVTTELNEFAFGPFLGLRVPVADRFSIQTLLGYDFGLTGEISYEGQRRDFDRDTESFGRVFHEWRGIYEATGQLGVGFGLGWSGGKTEVEDTSGELDFRGWGFGGVFLYSF
jgi:hypothetical protein